MKIINEAMLVDFRRVNRCENCNHYNREGAAHATIENVVRVGAFSVGR